MIHKFAVILTLLVFEAKTEYKNEDLIAEILKTEIPVEAAAQESDVCRIPASMSCTCKCLQE